MMECYFAVIIITQIHCERNKIFILLRSLGGSMRASRLPCEYVESFPLRSACTDTK